jgi:hypothetical protein
MQIRILEKRMNPFYEIRSEALKQMLGVKDKRSILKKLDEIGVQIRHKGKSKYVITEEVINSLRESNDIGYTGKSELSRMFTSGNKLI